MLGSFWHVENENVYYNLQPKKKKEKEKEEEEEDF